MSTSVQASRFAVAIATCGRPDALTRCLDALLTGLLLPMEVTVVDQRPYGRVRSLVEMRRRDGVRITYVAQPPLGLSASRNAAIAHTEAPYIAFTDDDCVPDSTWLDRLQRAFAGSTCPDAVTGRVLALGPEDAGHAVSLRTATARVDFHGRTVPWRVGTGANLAVSREWIQRIGGFDERLGVGSRGRAAEDADVIYRLLSGGAHVRYEPDAVVYHERLTEERRLATRLGYGHGIGALCGMHLRMGDPFALSMLGSWATSMSRRLRKALAARDGFELRQWWLSLRGTLEGLGYGLMQKPRRFSSMAVDSASRTAARS